MYAVSLNYFRMIRPDLTITHRYSICSQFNVTPMLCECVSAYTMRTVVKKHAELRHDNYPLSDMEERDENEFLWAVTALCHQQQQTPTMIIVIHMELHDM